MFCKKCGSANDDNAFQCAQCGESLQQTGPPRQQVSIPNYLVQAILVTIFCCLPFGIVAIVFAAQVNGKLAGGDIAGAQQASKNAKMWSWISFGIGLAVIAFWMLMNFLVVASAPGPNF